MTRSNKTSLKAQNMKWLGMLLFMDGLALACILVSESAGGLIQFNTAATLRLLTASIIPVLVLLIVNILPHELKSMLVYWKAWGWLPSWVAFSKYGLKDTRVNMSKLEKHLGTFPDQPAQQSALWYQLFKELGSEPEIIETHKLFLMYRDMAVLSLVCLAVLPFTLLVLKFGTTSALFATTLFALQYSLVMLSARWSGIRLVTTVLAIKSAKVVARAPRKPKKSNLE